MEPVYTIPVTNKQKIWRAIIVPNSSNVTSTNLLNIHLLLYLVAWIFVRSGGAILITWLLTPWNLGLKNLCGIAAAQMDTPKIDSCPADNSAGWLAEWLWCWISTVPPLSFNRKSFHEVADGISYVLIHIISSIESSLVNNQCFSILDGKVPFSFYMWR